MGVVVRSRLLVEILCLFSLVAVSTGCCSPDEQVEEKRLLHEIYEGATAEQPAPAGSHGDRYTHYVTHRDSGEDVLRVYFRDEARGIVPLDYEILDRTVTDEKAHGIIVEVLFVYTMNDYYRGRIEGFEMGRLGSTDRTRIPYPVGVTSGEGR